MNNQREIHHKVEKWIDRLTEFDLEFIHRPNTDGIIQIADGLSRMNDEYQIEPQYPKTDRATLAMEPMASIWMPWGTPLDPKTPQKTPSSQ